MTDPYEPTRRMPPVQPPVQHTQPEPPAAPPKPAWTIDAGRYWAGAVATAVVAALVGVVGTIVAEEILNVDLVVQDPFGTDSHLWAYVLGGAVAALLAAGLLQLLVIAAPRPQAFFGWIVGLVTVVAMLLPLTWTDDLGSAVASGLVNLVVGLSIGSLLGGVLRWTLHPTVP
ncbi:DUF6069 family protein [Actinotalea sp. M2MS4P-6]|uniref:DUF6069 family protein n=1 Tax=Actinotalea sp. M2MS4P-6 TaxID=2983762 RepID=UPI0021E41ECF|nr:DUF6069 family protein [Actinotalea sp. M2MS4P-6]MCV2394034.1 DUF6069 family protein [Actinotalea sp. M2MS4P-6]